jgi:o-succinylbenzoate---CoA ligase
MQVEQWLGRARRCAADVIALEDSSLGLSYRELDRLAGVGAAELGVPAGTRVGIALPPGLDFAIALHACLRLGAVAIPIDPRDPIAAREAVTIERPLRRDGPYAAGKGHDLDAAALIVRTSGTSGTPKEIPLTYGNLLWSAIGSAVALGLDRGERWLCTLPLVHVGGLSIVLRSAIYGTTAVLHERFETDAALRALMHDGITLVSVVATTLARLLDGGLHDPPALRCALAGGGPVPEALLERARAAGVPVSQTYGLTEASSQVATQAPGERRANAGPPLFCTHVALAPDGEILVSGPTVSPAAGAVLATGDLGALELDGSLTVIGRSADTIISGGENVAPAEVEAALEAHPAVLEAGVFGVADAEWGEAVHARVVLLEDEDEDEIGEEELRRHCARLLAPHKVPKRIALSGPLPRTASGKLARRLLAVDEGRASP